MCFCSKTLECSRQKECYVACVVSILIVLEILAHDILRKLSRNCIERDKNVKVLVFLPFSGSFRCVFLSQIVFISTVNQL